MFTLAEDIKTIARLEDVLEDANTLVMNLSKCSNKTRYLISSWLLNEVCTVSKRILRHIRDLMNGSR